MFTWVHALLKKWPLVYMYGTHPVLVAENWWHCNGNFLLTRDNTYQYVEQPDQTIFGYCIFEIIIQLLFLDRSVLAG